MEKKTRTIGILLLVLLVLLITFFGLKNERSEFYI